jgi:hypothetical protein
MDAGVAFKIDHKIEIRQFTGPVQLNQLDGSCYPGDGIADVQPERAAGAIRGQRNFCDGSFPLS